MKKVRADLIVEGFETEVVEFLQLCRKIQWCGMTGHHGSLVLDVDGDGSGLLKFSDSVGSFGDLPFQDGSRHSIGE